jgi:hypothetical protein
MSARCDEGEPRCSTVLYGARAAACATTRGRCSSGPRARPPVRARGARHRADDALLRAYLERIPVVTIDGVEAFELFVDEAS